MNQPKISKPTRKKPSHKNALGDPNDNQPKAKNLSRAVQGVKKRINFEVAPELKTDIQITAAASGMTIGEMFIEAFELWKQHKIN